MSWILEVYLSWLEGSADNRDVESSILSTSTRAWLSLVERLIWDQEVAGSNPVARIN